MNTKRICKSIVSLILAVMMLVSMFTVGIVSTSAAETDVAETSATTRYYFGFSSWTTPKRGWFANSSGGKEYTNFVSFDDQITHDIGNNVGSLTYNVYYVDVESSYTDAYITVSSDGKSPETSKITLDSSKITLITGWNYGNNAYFGQTNYSAGGDTSDNPAYHLVGSWINSYTSTDYPFNEANDYKVNLTLEAGTYKFKVYESTTSDEYCVASTYTVNDATTSAIQLYSKAADSTKASTVELVATGGDYTFTFDTSTKKLSITHTATGGGDDSGDDNVTVKDKIAFAMVNEIHLYSVTVDCISSTGVKTTVQIKEKNDLDTNRIAKNINGKLVEWPDSMEDTKPKQWSIYSVDIPADTKYIHFNTGHNSGTDVYWHLPLGDDAVEKDATETFNPDYHDLSNYNYTSELYVLYKYNNNEGNDNDKTKGYKSIKKTYEQFTDEEIPVFEITAKCAIKDQENDYDNEITIDPAGSSASLAGGAVDWTYSVYLENGDEDTLLASGLASDYKFPYTMTTPNTTYEFYIVVKPVGDTTNTATSDPVSTDYIATADPVLSATFTDDHDGSTSQQIVVITPHAYLDGDEIEDRASYTYDVYANGSKVNDKSIEGTEKYSITLEDGVETPVYIVVHHNTYGDATSSSKPYLYTTHVETVTFNVGLKSSTSYRYIPYVSVNGKEAVEMTYDKETPQESNTDYICHNKNGTQSYYWHWAEITIPVGEDAKITFTNLYNTIGSTITLSADDIEATKYYQFGYDNLNYSNTVYWLNDPALQNSSTVINFVETATHMIKADENSTERAQTRVNGTTYYVGDADGDGKLTIMDATTIQLALAKKTELTAVGTQIADYNLNNKLDVFDATIIQKKLAN